MSIQHQLAELSAKGRTVTVDLVQSILLDAWPRPAAVCDFGLDGGESFGKLSQKHYEALYYPIRAGEITPAELDAALGSGAKLTALVNSPKAQSNPHRGIVFKTVYDAMSEE